jgi:hypothetical protein
MGVGAPSGTVTFLFTDIEGSTRLWQADEPAMRAALERVGCQNSLMAADLVVRRTPQPTAEYAEDAPQDQETPRGPHQARSPHATSSLLSARILSLHLWVPETGSAITPPTGIRE